MKRLVDRFGNNKRVIITGATGFIGSHLAIRLVREGFTVHVIVKKGSDLGNLANIKNSISIHSHDGTIERMIKIFSKARPVIVFHLASLFLSRHRPEDVPRLIESNINFSSQLVEAMVLKRVNYLINTGTSWQHYMNDEYNPVNLYAATKQAFETILKYYVETSPLKVITLKLFDSYGPNDTRQKIINILIKTARENKSLKMSPGEQLMDLVYVDDIVEAYLLAAGRILGKGKKVEEFAVASRKPIKLNKLVDIISKVAGEQIPVQWGVLPYRKREVMHPWDKRKLLPGWKPKITLEEGLKRIMATE